MNCVSLWCKYTKKWLSQECYNDLRWRSIHGLRMVGTEEESVVPVINAAKVFPI